NEFGSSDLIDHLCHLPLARAVFDRPLWCSEEALSMSRGRAARFSVHAGCIPVCGNLFHHAVEMLLKGGLAKKRKLSLSELKKRGHKLKVLWREYKLDFPDPALKRHDKAISLLDKFEAIRYPDRILASGMGVGA